MLYELRIYQPHEGKAEALRQRFETATQPIFARHGIAVVGIFHPTPDDGNLVYLARFADAQAQRAAWAAFQADPEWQKLKASSEANGPLVQKMTITLMTPSVAGLLLG